MAHIQQCELGFAREPLRHPFGFKGGYLSQLWQPICRMTLSDGTTGMGTGVQSVLWSDALTFANHTQAGGNALMLAVTEHALGLLKGRPFTTPPELIHSIADQLHDYACTITNRKELPYTFTYNALVCVDFALWQIWAALHQHNTFDAITQRFCPALNHRQTELGNIPLISYSTSQEEIQALLESGVFVLKIKIGADPNGDQDMDAMCKWDIQRIQQVHAIASGFTSPYTHCGHPVYYLDANGRYDTPQRLQHLLEGIQPCGALARTILLEEPYAEDGLHPVHDLPVRVAADESVHGAQDAVRLIEQYGYSAIALKPIAKTLSLTMEVLDQAAARGVPCFCADLTVPPAMLEWNLNVAARLAPLPGLKVGVIESNGAQNYCNWASLLSKHPLKDATWLQPQNGLFVLPEQFYQQCAAFLPSSGFDGVL